MNNVSVIKICCRGLTSTYIPSILKLGQTAGYRALRLFGMPWNTTLAVGLFVSSFVGTLLLVGGAGIRDEDRGRRSQLRSLKGKVWGVLALLLACCYGCCDGPIHVPMSHQIDALSDQPWHPSIADLKEAVED